MINRSLLRHRLTSALSKLSHGTPVLLYHRVFELESDPLLLSVTPTNFAAHLEIIRQRFEPMSVSQLVDAISERRAPKNAIAITFDDGYEDNLTEAKPLLQANEIPATVFVATGYMRDPGEFWWDDLDRILLTDRDLPPRIHIRVGDLDIERKIDPPTKLSNRQHWNITSADNPSERHALYRQLMNALPNLPGPDIRKTLRILREWAGVHEEARPTHRTLDPDGVVKLASDGLVEVGAHTVNHPALASSSPDQQQAEIVGSKIDLEGILGMPIEGFAYPFGTLSHYNSTSRQTVRRANFRYSCSNFAGMATRLIDQFQIPRLLVRNLDADAFRRFLAGAIK